MRTKYYALCVPAVLLLAGCSGDGLGDTGALSGIELHFTEDGSPEVLLQEGGVESDEESSLVIEQGEGEDIDPGQILQVSTAAVDPASGAVQQENFSEDFPSLLYLPLIEEQSEFIYDSLTDTDVNVGAELALYEPASEGDAEDPMAQPAPESLIILRVDDQVPAHAQGESQEQSGDLPEITGEADEAPQLSEGDEDVETPEETASEVLIQGEGEGVEADDQVVVQYTGWRASDGSVFDSSWAGVEPESGEDGDSDENSDEESSEDEAAEEGAAEDESAEDDDVSMPYAEALSNLVEGWAAGLEGQQVGSRVLMVIPPEEGYGDAEGHDLEEETLIFAVDIIAAAPMPEPQEQQMPEQPELSEEELEEMLEEMEQGQEGGGDDAEDGDAEQNDETEETD